MSDTVFREKLTEATNTEEVAQVAQKSPSTSVVDVEVPYTEYKSQKGRPYVVDYYQIGDTWQEKVGGFETEVNTLDMYLKDKIEEGLMENSVGAVKEAIRKIEKLCGVNKEDRVVSKIAKISAYAEFLLKTKRL